MEGVKLISVVLVIRVFAASGDELILRSAHQLKDTAITPCETDIDCDDIENGTCVHFFCSCGNTNNCVNRNKLMVTKIGEKCTTGEDCNIKHSLCENDKCSCQKGNVASKDQRTCLRIATELGSTCKDSVQCQAAVPHSTCQNDKCACEEHMHQYNGSCYSNVGLGQDCQCQGECSATTFAVCAAGICVCRDGYVRSKQTEKCLEVATKIDAPCYEDVQCSPGFGMAVCKSGHCQCEELYNFKQSRNVCVRDMLLGDPCVNHSDCHSPEPGDDRLECILGECKCHSDYVEVYGYCTSGSSHHPNTSGLTLLCLSLLCVYIASSYQLNLE